MFARILLVLGLTLLAVQIPAAAQAAAPAGYTQVWSDEFNGTSVDTSKWHYRTDVKGWSAQRPENVTVGNGLMTIHLKEEPVPYNGMAYSGGGLVSKKAFRYGYYETRAKTNVGSGWHTSFWAMAGDGSNTFHSGRRTEIDGFEMDSHLPGRLTHNVHGWKPDGTKTTVSSGHYTTGFDTSAAFHTYGFEWAETQVKFYVDGVLKYTGNYSPTCCTQHDFINVWLTTIAINLQNSPGVDTSALPGQVQFDYFRYYQRDGYTDNEGPTAYRYAETGTWTTSSIRGHTLENTSRYSNEPAASATWGAWLPAAGTYDVYIYKIVYPGSDTGSRIDVTHSGGTSTQSLDYTAGSTGWVKLGTWSFGAGESGSVKLTRSDGNARADAVKFVRVS
jgi:beta-glucanase (GH16 family)